MTQAHVSPADAVDYDPLKGETKAQMAHAKTWKARDYDTSADLDFEKNDKTGADTYVKLTAGIYLLIKTVLFYPLLFLALLPVVLLCICYMKCIPQGTDHIDRGCGFTIISILCHTFGFLAILLAVFAYIFDCCFYCFFGVIYCTLNCGWSDHAAGQKFIAPYRGGPSLLCHSSDIIVALMGQSIRQGVLEMTHLVTMMFVAMPTLKYYVNCNPLVYKLDERFVQQISTSMQDMPLEACSDMVQQIISRAKQDPAARERIDNWNFIPHYPYPPPARRWAIGMQTGGAYFSLLVHATHALAASPGDPQSHFVLSNSVEVAIYRVMLWYNNPYHFFTGYVEASISNGKERQTNKYGGGEHPMWLVTGHSPLLTSRDSPTGVGMIDAFFDRFLPFFVDEMRRMIRGPKAAEELHEEVLSKDGVSRPAQNKVVPKWSELQGAEGGV